MTDDNSKLVTYLDGLPDEDKAALKEGTVPGHLAESLIEARGSLATHPGQPPISDSASYSTPDDVLLLLDADDEK